MSFGVTTTAFRVSLLLLRLIIGLSLRDAGSSDRYGSFALPRLTSSCGAPSPVLPSRNVYLCAVVILTVSSPSVGAARRTTRPLVLLQVRSPGSVAPTPAPLDAFVAWLNVMLFDYREGMSYHVPGALGMSRKRRFARGLLMCYLRCARGFG